MTDEGKRRTAAVPKTWYYDNDGGGPFAAPTDLQRLRPLITRGVVGSMLPVGYNAGNEIVQAPGVLALRNEMIHETRVIPLDGRPHYHRCCATTWATRAAGGKAIRSSSIPPTSPTRPASGRTGERCFTARRCGSPSASHALPAIPCSTRSQSTTRSSGPDRGRCRFHSLATMATGCSCTPVTKEDYEPAQHAVSVASRREALTVAPGLKTRARCNSCPVRSVMPPRQWPPRDEGRRHAAGHRRTCCGAPLDVSDVFTRKRWPSCVTSKAWYAP